MALLDDVKNYLDITWTDNASDLKVAGIIDRGKSYLNEIARRELDFDIEDKPRELLFEYARYVRSNMLDEFQTRYLHELKNLQLRVVDDV